MNKQYKSMADKLAKAGRFGDDRILHVSQAELEGLGSMLPSGKLPINPETGQPEAFLLTSMLIGAAIGGLTGGLSAKEKNIPLWQGILQGAGIGGATSALTAGLGSALGGAGGTATSSVTEAAASEGLGETLTAASEEVLNQAVERNIEEGAKNYASSALSDVVTDQVFDNASRGVAQSSLDSSLASNPMLQTPGSSIAATPPAPAATPSSVPVNPAGPPDLLLSTGPNNPIGSVPTGPPPASPQIPLDAPAGPMPPVTGPGSALQTEQPSSFLADQFTKEAAQEALASYKNPLNILAPAFMTQALLPYEEDEEDYLAGYYGPYNKTWASGSGVSWAARNGGMVPRPRLNVSFNQGGLASLRRR